jgi:hypothetical protein
MSVINLPSPSVAELIVLLGNKLTITLVPSLKTLDNILGEDLQGQFGSSVSEIMRWNLTSLHLISIGVSIN